MKSKVLSILIGVPLAVIVMIGVYTQLNPVTQEKQDYSNTVTQYQQQESVVLDTVDQKFAEISNIIERLSLQVERLTEQVNNENRDLEPTSAATNTEADSDQNSQLTPIEPEQTLEQRLNNNFIAEQINDDWSIAAQNNLQALFLNQDNVVYTSSQLESIECRSTSCKVKINHDSDIDSEEFEMSFLIDAARAGFPKARGFYDNEFGVDTATYYVTQPPPL